MALMDGYVCLACERNRHDVCPGCACEHCAQPREQAAKTERVRAIQRRRTLANNKPPSRNASCRHRGGQHGARIETETAHAVAVDLMATCPCCDLPAWTKQELATAHGVTYEQVRTVLRNLQTLHEARTP